MGSCVRQRSRRDATPDDVRAWSTAPLRPASRCSIVSWPANAKLFRCSEACVRVINDDAVDPNLYLSVHAESSHPHLECEVEPTFLAPSTSPPRSATGPNPGTPFDAAGPLRTPTLVLWSAAVNVLCLTSAGSGCPLAAPGPGSAARAARRPCRSLRRARGPPPSPSPDNVRRRAAPARSSRNHRP